MCCPILNIALSLSVLLFSHCSVFGSHSAADCLVWLFEWEPIGVLYATRLVLQREAVAHWVSWVVVLNYVGFSFVNVVYG